MLLTSGKLPSIIYFVQKSLLAQNKIKNVKRPKLSCLRVLIKRKCIYNSSVFFYKIVSALFLFGELQPCAMDIAQQKQSSYTLILKN
jgi:hypothetical protein